MTMSSLRDRFATLDRVPMPELWSDVQQRAAHLRSAEPVTSVTVGSPVRSTRLGDRTMAPLAAAALLIALLAGAIAVGSGLVRLPAILPAPLVSPSGAPSPISATQSPSDAPAPWIIFLVGVSANPPERMDLLWAMRADGSDAHEIAAGGPVAWSPDGTRLLMLSRAFPNNGSILVADVGEDVGPFVDTGVEEPVNEQWEAFDFAPDGERVVFVRKSKCPTASAPFGVSLAETPGANCYVLSILDLRTGQRTDLDETLVKDQTNDERPGSLELPAWSPDGAKIAYTRVDQTPRTGGTRELWVVNADGTNPARVELASDVSVQEPRWSPDGTRISFTSETQLSADQAESAVFVADVATGRLERITVGSDAAAGELCCTEWLDRTHLRVKGGARTDPDRFWLVALDAGPPEAQVLVDLTELLAAADAPPVSMRSAPGEPGRMFFWQPAPAGQP
jgi:hypothetical protein